MLFSFKPIFSNGLFVARETRSGTTARFCLILLARGELWPLIIQLFYGYYDYKSTYSKYPRSL